MGAQITKIIQETTFLSDPESETANIEYARHIYDAIPGEGDDKHKTVKQLIRGNPEIKA